MQCGSWPSKSSGLQTLFSSLSLPKGSVTAGEPQAIGIALSSSTAGSIHAIRFFHLPPPDAAAPSPVGLVYDDRGGLVATTAEIMGHGCGRGWVSVPLTQPLAVKAGREYVVVLDNVVGYPGTDEYFATSTRRGRLSVPAGGGRVGPAGTMPVAAEGGTNFWVDGRWYVVAGVWDERGWGRRAPCRPSLLATWVSSRYY